MKKRPIEELKLSKIVGGGQAMGELADGRKTFLWGGLPGETVKAQLTKVKRNMAEGVVVEVIEPSPERVEPLDSESYLSTSPWQIMRFEAEQKYKQQLIDDAFKLHHVELGGLPALYSDEKTTEYRNKVEFSWYWDNEKEQLELAFFKRASQGKIPVDGMSLIPDYTMKAAKDVRDILRRRKLEARELKTLLIRRTQAGKVVLQLYVKTKKFEDFNADDLRDVQGYEIIYSEPKSPASVITKRLHSRGDITLNDTVLATEFHYACEGFFQVNIPMYERALMDMKKWLPNDTPVVDFYSGVGTIGLTIGGNDVTLVESNESAVREMKRNIEHLGIQAKAVHAPAEKSLEYINGESTIIVDPPRAGLHADVIYRLLETLPKTILYLSCNPVTQARDYAMLKKEYKIVSQQGYNFFPRTPHIENLLVIERR